MEKSHIVPIHIKSGKQNIKSYRPVSFLPIFGKIFERFTCNKIFSYFSTNKLISSNQSGFQPDNFCINHLLLTIQEIFIPFDNELEVISAFSDISKAFHKVWHEGLIFKLKQNGISGELFLVTSYLIF